MGTIKSFSDLDAWKYAHRLVVYVVTMVDSFPDKDKYTITPQILPKALVDNRVQTKGTSMLLLGVHSMNYRVL
jgi:hypothetical protein